MRVLKILTFYLLVFPFFIIGFIVGWATQGISIGYYFADDTLAKLMSNFKTENSKS